MRINVGKTSKTNFEKSPSKKASNNSKLRSARLEENAMRRLINRAIEGSVEEFYEEEEQDEELEDFQNFKKYPR
jgi:hypothetical protein